MGASKMFGPTQCSEFYKNNGLKTQGKKKKLIKTKKEFRLY